MKYLLTMQQREIEFAIRATSKFELYQRGRNWNNYKAGRDMFCVDLKSFLFIKVTQSLLNGVEGKVGQKLYGLLQLLWNFQQIQSFRNEQSEEVEKIQAADPNLSKTRRLFVYCYTKRRKLQMAEKLINIQLRIAALESQSCCRYWQEWSLHGYQDLIFWPKVTLRTILLTRTNKPLRRVFYYFKNNNRGIRRN